MPELPEVETVIRSLSSIQNCTIKNVKIITEQLRYKINLDLKNLLLDKKINNIERRGKYIIIHLSKGYLIIHLGMTGKLLIEDTVENNKHTHLIITLDNNKYLTYNDIRKFGFIIYYEGDIKKHDFFINMGVEPLTDHYNFNYLKKKISNSSQTIKQFLLDQNNIAGLGNIYVIEILYNCGIHPLTKVQALTDQNIEQIILETKKILLLSIQLGGSSISDYRDAFNKKGKFQDTFNIYGKKLDPLGNEVIKIKQNGRGTYYVPKLQTLKIGD